MTQEEKIILLEKKFKNNREDLIPNIIKEIFGLEVKEYVDKFTKGKSKVNFYGKPKTKTYDSVYYAIKCNSKTYKYYRS
jgi:hypothetical protein